MSTWEGFFSSQGFIVQSKDDDVQIKNSRKLRWLPENKKTEVTAMSNET
jgi:hypothetical protein